MASRSSISSAECVCAHVCAAHQVSLLAALRALQHRLQRLIIVVNTLEKKVCVCVCEYMLHMCVIRCMCVYMYICVCCVCVCVSSF